IMEHEVFYRAMGVYFTKKKLPVKKEVIDIMKDSRLIYDYNDSTIERRAQTVLKWLEWIVSLVE
ncbi:MAG: translation elongation factor, partial [Halanaerobiales bacterium]